MAKAKLSVATADGTITRTTDREYAFVVVARGQKHSSVNGHREAQRKALQGYVKEYTEVVEGRRPTQYTATIADYQRYLSGSLLELDGLDAKFDAQIEAADRDLVEPFEKGTWSSKLYLARREYDKLALTYRDVRVYDVATGALVLGTEVR
jgi:hypothetical protein